MRGRVAAILAGFCALARPRRRPPRRRRRLRRRPVGGPGGTGAIFRVDLATGERDRRRRGPAARCDPADMVFDRDGNADRHRRGRRGDLPRRSRDRARRPRSPRGGQLSRPLGRHLRPGRPAVRRRHRHRAHRRRSSSASTSDNRGEDAATRAARRWSTRPGSRASATARLRRHRPQRAHRGDGRRRPPGRRRHRARRDAGRRRARRSPTRGGSRSIRPAAVLIADGSASGGGRARLLSLDPATGDRDHARLRTRLYVEPVDLSPLARRSDAAGRRLRRAGRRRRCSPVRPARPASISAGRLRRPVRRPDLGRSSEPPVCRGATGDDRRHARRRPADRVAGFADVIAAGSTATT